MRDRTSHPTHRGFGIQLSYRGGGSDQAVANRITTARAGDDSNSSSDDAELEGPEDAFQPELDTVTDESVHVHLDDSDAQDLDVGISIDQPTEEADDRDANLVFDIAELLTQVDTIDPLDDAEGPREQADAEYGSFDEIAGLSRDESIEDALTDDVLISPELPELDADSDGKMGFDSDMELDTEISDDPLPPWSEARWRESRATTAPTAILAAWGRTVLLCSRSAEWIDGATSRGIAHQALESQALSAVLLSESHGLISDARGQLTLVRTDADFAESCGNWRSPLRLEAHDSTTLQVHRASTAHPQRLLGLASDGRLIRTPDGGRNWSTVELHGRVLALDTSMDLCTALLQHRQGRTLVTSTDAGSNWRMLETPLELVPLLRDLPPRLAAMGSAIAVAHPLRGLVLSTNGGSCFTRVQGCSDVTAVRGGEVAGAAGIWAALHQQGANITSIILLREPHWQPVRIAELRCAEATISTAEPASSRVLALEWQPELQRLWGAGDFGAVCWEAVAGPLAS